MTAELHNADRPKLPISKRCLMLRRAQAAAAIRRSGTPGSRQRDPCRMS
jgi:hypothetical protein